MRRPRRPALPLLFATLLAAASAGAARDAATAPTDAKLPEDLPATARAWLEEVDPLILPAEREAYLALAKDYQRRAFQRRFWEVRDPYPETSRNELEDRWAERARAARDRYETLADPRARMLLVHGPPAEVLEPRCGATLRPVEIWRLTDSDLVRGGFSLVFVRDGGDERPWRLWRPVEGLRSLVLLPATGPASEAALAQQVATECFRGEDVLAALAGALDWERQEDAGAHYPAPDPEWVAAFQARTTDLPADALPLPASFAVTYPARHQSRTVLEGIVAVPTAAATAGPSGEGPVYAFLVDGEVLRRGELFESFRYRFDVPVDRAAADEIPLLLERYLRPGDYRLLVRVEDVHGGRFFRWEGEVEVPLVDRTAAGVVVASRPAPATGTDPPSPAASTAEPVVRLAAPPDELLTGLVRIAADVRGEGIARVRFELDDRPLLAKTRPPFSVEIDVGRTPMMHTVTAIAEDASGEALASDTVALNAGPHRFSVRLVEPRVGAPAGERLRAQAVVEVPRGERLDRVELYLDETRLATLYQPPFVQPLPLLPEEEVTFVRAVAYLAAGGTAEDLVFLHAPENLDEMDVRLVELYTTVLDKKGRPALGLEASDFRVEEDGEPQQLVRFEWVENLPVHAAVLLDTSTSMLEELDEAERAAETFFQKLLTPRDRAAVITFNDTPQLRVPFTNQVEVLAGGLAGLRVEGETALWDSTIYALYYFSGIKGKRLLVLLSDGEDVKSAYRFEDVLAFAHRSGVAIYTIGLNLPSKADLARTSLSRLASETGGRAFFVDRAVELDRVYDSIERELRSQYLLAYQAAPGSAGDAFRKVAVTVERAGLEARTLRGYYP